MGDLTWSGIDFSDITDIKSTSTAIAKTVDCVITKLSIKTTEKDLLLLKGAGHPNYTILAYDVWVDWAINSILDWPLNMFYGKGEGDHAGTWLDIPTVDNDKKGLITTAIAAAQYKRVQGAMAMLKDIIPGLSDDKVVPVNKYDKVYTQIGQKQLGALAGISMQDKQLLQRRSLFLETIEKGVTALIEGDSKKRKYESLLQDDNPNQFLLVEPVIEDE